MSTTKREIPVSVGDITFVALTNVEDPTDWYVEEVFIDSNCAWPFANGLYDLLQAWVIQKIEYHVELALREPAE